MAQLNTRKKKNRVGQVLLFGTIILCAASLLFAAWLLFVPNSFHHFQTLDRKNSTVQTDSQSDAILSRRYVAVLEGNTVQLVGLEAERWTSNDESVATVDMYGNITGIKQGRCKITGDKGYTYQVAVRKLEIREGCTYVDDILVVNKTYSLPKNYAPGLEPIAKDAFLQMQDAAAKEGQQLYIGSDYRSYDYQVQIYNNYCKIYGWEIADTFSARPGHSEHQSGLTIDCNTIDDAFAETSEAVWLAEHCAEYGFIIRFPEGKENVTGYKYEPWHIRYVGIETAQEIQRYGLTLEEYLGVMSEYAQPWQG